MIVFSLMFFALSFTGCKSKQKAAQEQTISAQKQRVEQAKRDLLEIINDQGSMSLEEKENRLNIIKNQNFNDQEIKDLTIRAENILSKIRADREAKLKKEAKKGEKVEFRQSILEHFRAVATAYSFSDANLLIARALKLYASTDVPVLIIVSEENGVKDYDRPTTIKKYLEYIKDVRKFDKGIESFILDNNGKITEIELIKK
jgi:hypothetical protein